ncbi:sugar phosphate nucleotidyltransferase [Pseudomonas sp. UFMG81]|uniref:sugar phosphate nucleotidyltransferase n=1 Tax=Pseudomonas sp. UFMG81 TaxID=2745936 RepID=UPI00188F9176|nr:sugar phosphate nucleotidyltransferase [Pseudomonas sp. UFMG81]
MQIVIPMSGFGERFRRAGYTVPKPLVEIDGKPIIGHVIDMFPGEHDFLFICNEDHLRHPEYQMEATLRRLCPTGRIESIPAHKLGPINAVRQVEHLLDPERPVVVNYCDFTCYWDWPHFKQFVRSSGCAGAIPAYKGFHPHSLGSTNYAYIREANGWITDIQEKQPYTDNRMDEYASSGTYYFSSARLMSKSFRHAMDEDLNVGGEYYVSLAYKALFKDALPVAVYPLQHFMQWGTPDDVAEYLGWSKAFRGMAEVVQGAAARGSLVIPMAGLGQRFAREGYDLTKPLIPVSGKPMVIQATDDLPKGEHHAFVLRQDMPGVEHISATLSSTYPQAVIKSIPGVTEGQACTALIGLDALAETVADVAGPVTFGACDNGALYSMSRLQALMDDASVDVIVWGVRGHANAVRHPQMFGWIDSEQGLIKRISVKTPLGQPATDPVVLGTFTFREAEGFRRVVDRLIDANDRINGEFYIDSCINHAIALGLKCVLFEVDAFLSWGTPNDLRTFEYWQSCFHKWASHPYRLELDTRVPEASVATLEEHYRAQVPVVPGPQA